MNHSASVQLKTKRRLAAVVFTDVVGYSARMQGNETGTIAEVEADLSYMRMKCVEQGGEFLNSMGDGLMLAFPSAVDAVSFALKIQGDFSLRKAGVPSDVPLDHRIGIHIGDVIFMDDGTAAGDGVNIAARLEGKAPPGGVCISQTVYDTVKGKVSMHARFIGPEQFKNIAQPILVWHVSLEEDTAVLNSRFPAQPVAKSGATRIKLFLRKLNQFKGAIVILGAVAILSGLVGYWNFYQGTTNVARSSKVNSTAAKATALSIVVLPFANITGDPSQSYVSDGLTSSVTADLSRIHDAFIVNVATAFSYKDKGMSAQQVGQELGVRFVLQGNVQRSGNKIRINAQLADSVSNAQLWSESFDGDQADLFALQDKVTSRIANSIGHEMVIAAARNSETRKSEPQVADLLLRASALNLRPQTLKTFLEIETCYRDALQMEPDNTTAMAGLSLALAMQANSNGFALGKNVREAKYIEARDLALNVSERDPGNPSVYRPLALYARSHDDYLGALRNYEMILSLEPNNPVAMNGVALILISGGESKRAIELLHKAIDLDPKHPRDVIMYNLGKAYFMQGNNEKAIEWLLKTVQSNSSYASTYAYLAMAYAVQGEAVKARAAVSELLRLNPDFNLSETRKPQSSSPVAYREWFEKKYLPAARKAGLPE
jgi:TolB-like protein/class 3 adenylate cyclase/cytochrome c-type biogenesis protein CcmH/NrfG